MDGKKRGLWLLMIILLMGFVLGGYCTNPNLIDIYCVSDMTQAQCPGYYHDTFPDACSLGCCFDSGGTVCQEGTYKGLCYGEFADTCGEIADDKCAYGCCCWLEETKQSLVTFKGTCDAFTSSVFNDAIEDPAACSTECDTAIINPPNPDDSLQCSDGIDNDMDNLVDAADPGCRDLNDNYHPEDDSESENLDECFDGLDNDNDGATDMDDTCCSDNTKPENFCDISICPADTKLNLASCNCENSYVCSQNQYCCPTGCFNAPCSSGTCVEGTKRSCGQVIGNCETFQFCQSGQWTTECTSLPSCDLPIEQCSNGIDDNSDGVVDCDDVICHGIECTHDADSCGDKGYLDTLNGIWKCCYPGNVNDCDNDGTPDTCGICDCNIVMPSPQIMDVSVRRGTRGMNIEWGLTCDRDIYLYKCVGSCSDYNQFSLILAEPDTYSFLDEDIVGDTEYCYYVQAQYETDVRNSEIKCINSGSEVCMQFESQNICLDAEGGFEVPRVQRAHCTDLNALELVETCQEGYMCMGPYVDGTTKCVYQSPCDDCGDTLNMFSDYDESKTRFYDPASGSTFDMLCKEVPTCYYDYSDTSVDKFHECSEVDYCYRYRSKSACEQQLSIPPYNKCLPRECQWVPLPGSIDKGICFEKIDEFRKCSYCNLAENNNIFDHCTREKCQMFGDCYSRRYDGRCVEATDFTCQDYSSEQDCTGGHDVSVNVAYNQGARIAGNYDNVVTPSQDAVGVGLCKWDTSVFPNCYKDADDDGFPDPGQQDITPPFTRIVSNSRVRTLNITLEVADPNPDGSMGVGVKYTYVCMDDSSRCYPTTAYLPENAHVSVDFGGGQGEHHIYFYSEDNANNLEVLKTAIIGVDRTPPVIHIQSQVHLDISNFSDSSVIFIVSVSENATCMDSFEGASPQISSLYGSSWIPSYSGLSDGTYAYVVNCTDDVGNRAAVVYSVKIDADHAIFSSSPAGFVESSPVLLSVKTDQNIPCRFGPDEASYSELPFSFGSPTQGSDVNGTYYLHTYNYDLVDSGIYSFDVKCQLADRNPDDEIQFIYDGDIPVTIVQDANGLSFNFSRIYQGIQDRVFLACTDSPLGGFGCNATYYCLSSSQCTPDVQNDPLQPINYTLGPTSETWLCYKSIENTVDGKGGRQEPVVCNEITIDHYGPVISLTDVNNTDSGNPFVTWREHFNLKGIADDPDASGAQSNIVKIVVSASGHQISYNVTAVPNFEQQILLGDGLNTITIVAQDRSGATVSKTAYIMLAEYSGEKITLINPTFGVSPTRTFDLVAQTYTDAECRWSYNDAPYDSSIPMQKTVEPSGEDYIYYHTYANFQLGDLSEIEEPLYIKCVDLNMSPFEKYFTLMWDDTSPEILDISIDNSDGKDPPTVVEFPLETNIVVKTDDKVRCRYSSSMENFNSMIKFTGYENTSISTENKQFFGNLLNPSDYSYYIQCENGAGSLSDRQQFTFNVDTSASTGFTFLEPPSLVGTSSLRIKLSTTKTSNNCKFGISTPNQSMESLGSKTHQTPIINVVEGQNLYHFSCLITSGMIQDTYAFTVDLTPPSKPVIDDGTTTKYLTSLSAKWTSIDEVSGVTTFEYAIGSTAGATDISSWQDTNGSTATVNGLTLEQGHTYYWSVRAMNGAGLWSETAISDGVIVSGDVIIPNTSIDCSTDSDCNDDQFCTNDVCLNGRCSYSSINCLDSRDCTQDSCDDSIDACVHETDNCLCTSSDQCQDGSPCTDDVCDHGTCSSSFNTAPCNDNDLCTIDDTCSGGVCISGPERDCNDFRSCSTDSCVSSLGCVYEMESCFCRSDLDCDDGRPCTVDTCDESNRVCSATTFSPPGTTCDNWLWCDEQDACDGRGNCIGSQRDCSSTLSCAVTMCVENLDICEENLDTCSCLSDGDCNDQNPCTDDSCSTNSTCEYSYNSGTCDDDNACTVDDSCQEGRCVGELNHDCEPTPECSSDSDCDDGLFCTEDVCNDGTCDYSGLHVCADSRDCTTDRCDEVQDTCIHETDNCVCFSDTDCGDGNPCTDDVCENSVCRSVANSLSCNDNNLCTGNDFCMGGECFSGDIIDCDDGRSCSTDSCDANLGCVYDMMSCTCSVDIDCNDDDPCTIDKCNGGTCSAPELEPTGTTCNNWLWCDTGDVCDSVGQCVGSAMECSSSYACAVTSCVESLDICQENLDTCDCLSDNDCDDQNPCTEDSCASDGTCAYSFNTNSCDDGEECTLSDVCQEGLCVGTYDSSCDPDISCTNDLDCNDGRFCTIGRCNSGVCDFTQQRECADSRDCTEDRCDEVQDVCVHETEDCQCSDDSECQDGNPCTDEVCENAKCSSENNNNACNDNNLCTIDDTCSNGGCRSGGVLDCDDGRSCSEESCDINLGCVYNLESCSCQSNVDCADGDPCTIDSCNTASETCEPYELEPSGTTCNNWFWCDVEDTCNSAGHCIGKPKDCTSEFSCAVSICIESLNTCEQSLDSCECSTDADCDDSSICTNDSCGSDGTCEHQYNSLSCDDGEDCTKDDSCVEGICIGEQSSDCAVDVVDVVKGCTDDYDCDSGDVCNNGECVHSHSGGGCTDDSDCDTGEICESGQCVEDTDVCMVAGQIDSDCDGLPDSWERTYGIEVGPNSYDEDPDGDGLSNHVEYIQNTDPTVPDEAPANHLWVWILLIIVMLIIVAGGGYIGYTEYEKKSGKNLFTGKPLTPRPRPRINLSQGPKGKSLRQKYIDSLSSMIRKKRQSQKKEARNNFLSAFDDKKDIDIKKLPEKPVSDKGAKSNEVGGQKKSPSTSKKSVQKPGPKPASKKPKTTLSVAPVKRPDEGLLGLTEVAKNVRGEKSLKELKKIAKK